MRDDKKRACVAGQRCRMIKECRTHQHESCSRIHGIPDQPIWAASHQSARRIERRWSAASNERESEDACQREYSTAGSQEHPADLPRADNRGLDDTCRRQVSGGEENQYEADEERSVGYRASNQEHLTYANAGGGSKSPCYLVRRRWLLLPILNSPRVGLYVKEEPRELLSPLRSFRGARAIRERRLSPPCEPSIMFGAESSLPCSDRPGRTVRGHVRPGR